MAETAPCRRTVLLALLAGCGDRPTDSTAADSVGSDSQTTADSATPDQTTAAESPTAYTGAEITQHLPAEPEGWTERDRPATAVAELGATASVLVVYERTDGLAAFVYVVAFRSAGAASRNARSWASAGWQVTVAVERLLFAATTGTPDVTLTPERPPQVPGTSVAGTDDALIELLAASPTLTADQIRANR